MCVRHVCLWLPLFPVNLSDLVDGFIAGVLQPQVDHGVLERPAHVELQRQIIHPLDVERDTNTNTVFLCTDDIFSDTLQIKD